MARRSTTPLLPRLTLQLAGVQAAYARAEAVSAAWHARDERWGISDTWQIAAVECMMLPGVWDHLKAYFSATTGRSRVFDLYQPTRSTVGDHSPTRQGLPGYSMMPWAQDAPGSTVWDGIRREIPGSDTGYQLQCVAFTSRDNDAYQTAQQRRGILYYALQTLATEYGITVEGIDL